MLNVLDIDPERRFEGIHSLHNWVCSDECRQYSLDIVNDPRMQVDNVIAKRFAAFNHIMVCAAFMATTACTAVLQPTKAWVEIERAADGAEISYKYTAWIPPPAEGDTNGNWTDAITGEEFALWTAPKDMARDEVRTPGVLARWLEVVGFYCMCATIMMNMSALSVITLQYYHIFRLMTCSAHGFDCAKSYYLHVDNVFFRHIAIRGFFLSVPFYIFGIACMLWIKIKSCDQFYPLKWFILCSALMVAVGVHLINKKHAEVFKHKYNQLYRHRTDMHEHQNDLDKEFDPQRKMDLIAA